MSIKRLRKKSKMAEIAVKLATTAGEKLVEQLVGELVGELSLLIGVRGEIQYIIDELEILRLFLKEAEEEQACNDVSRAWVKQVRQLSYAVEDCLEDFSLHIPQGNRLNPLAHLSHSLGSLTARHRIAIEIQNIKHRVEEVSSRRMRYGINTREPSKPKDYVDTDVRKCDPRLSALFMEDSQLVGIDIPRDKLVGWLLDEAKQLNLMAVVGGGGLGKTTIVKKAYDHPNVTGGHFQCRAWITVSQTYNVEGILKDITKQVIPDYKVPSSKERVEMPIEKLRGHLKDKRYIIIFDDVWEIDAWKDLEMSLPRNELGSRIILTTRNNELAESARATPGIGVSIFPHNKLTPKDSMKLFLRRVFNNLGQEDCPDDMKDLTLKILEKCDGLPLAIISIAGVLASKPDKSSKEWQKILDRLGSELEHNPNLKGMNKVLTMSYNDLPYYVRHCFLYLSKFPEDYVIERKRIQRLWIAEGFVSVRHDMTVGEVAESYFNELANRFMILPSDFSANGKVRSFRVHDIMLELITSKSREEMFLSLIVGNKDSELMTSTVIRRLSVHGTSEHVERSLSPSYVRSLTLQLGGMTPLISPLFRMLRVLDLEGCGGSGTKHLKIVTKLLHLKYFSLRDTWVFELPRGMERLRKLETLDTWKTRMRTLPKGIIKLQQLRFLRGGRCMKIPRGIGRLSALQVLTCIDAARSGKQAMKELRKLTQLQKLEVRELPEELMEDFCDSLAAMRSSLRSLKVQGVYTAGFFGRLCGLNSLSEAPLLLESITLEGELKQLPIWVLSLSNLVKLCLEDSCLEADDIQSLGSLPNLIRLKLRDRSFEGASLCFGAQGFPRLKELIIWRLRNVKSVSFHGGAMCNLERVSIGSRSGSVRISGITNLPSLKELGTEMKDGEDLDDAKAQLAQHPNRPTFMEHK